MQTMEDTSHFKKFDKNINIIIVGLGVIGGSFAYALSEIGYRNIYGVDTDNESLKLAKDAGVIKAGYNALEDIADQGDLIILAVYPKLVVKVLEKSITKVKKNAIITDVTGVKLPIIKEVSKIVGDRADFIFGHPMAGREKRGFQFATSAVYKGANYILINGNNKPENVEKLKSLIYEIGFGSIKEISASMHDELISYTSQLTHCLAVALVNSDKEGRETERFIGDSYRDLTRISKINEKLWSELFIDNKEYLLQAIELFEIELDKIKNAVSSENYTTLETLFIKSTKRREAMDNK